MTSKRVHNDKKNKMIDTLHKLDDDWFLDPRITDAFDDLIKVVPFTEKQLNVIKRCQTQLDNTVAIVLIKNIKLYPNIIQLQEIFSLFDDYEIIEDFRPKYFKVSIKDEPFSQLKPIMETFMRTKSFTNVKLSLKHGIVLDLLLSDEESDDLFTEFVQFLIMIKLSDLAEKVIDRNGLTLQEVLDKYNE